RDYGFKGLKQDYAMSLVGNWPVCDNQVAAQAPIPASSSRPPRSLSPSRIVREGRLRVVRPESAGGLGRPRTQRDRALAVIADLRGHGITDTNTINVLAARFVRGGLFSARTWHRAGKAANVMSERRRGDHGRYVPGTWTTRDK